MPTAQRLHRYWSMDMVLDDAVDAPLAELSISNLVLWPAQRITYTRLLFCAGYVGMSLVAFMACVMLLGLYVALLPCTIVDALWRYHVHGWHPRWLHHNVTLAVVELLVFCATWMHNIVCPKPLCIHLQTSDGDALLAYERSPILRHRHAIAPYCCKIKTEWESWRDVRRAAMYFLVVRPALSGFAIAWAAYVVACVAAVALALAHWHDGVHFAFFTREQGRVQDALGTFVVAMALNCGVVVGFRMCVVRVMCWATRRYCCELLYPPWIHRTSMTEVSATMEPFA
ncbi:hypothetical protein H310_09649 [Aphanomyces invadans]|uniref:Uncharacterized protein n=1 Tax=Aphanomyces invadans TaxID=157072 RepID=A0A024TUK1_9STRA|nr:hypothetical protein H310_09649 [Aphanomyces invadans]ETV97301.1 hypothetical protein H310_09649 [Aphanomyces invadans]|eukprot:XP_008874009.1 hypothetical protein H310_09649 [Aphanomyces invadans]